MKVIKLTQAQELKLEVYRNKGIEVGLATDQGEDLEWAKEVTQKHRELCGVPLAKDIVILDSPFAAISKYKGLTNSNALYGQHDVPWLYFCAFFRFECGLIKETESIKYLLELTRVGWMWFGRNTTVITRRPSKIHLVDKVSGVKLLHNEQGMALEYRDGTGLYALNGMRIPNQFTKFITNKENNKAKDILNIDNSEIRSEVIKMMGPGFMYASLNPQTLDKNSLPRGGDYELYKVDIDGTSRTYLTGVCPSKGDRWHEAVHPDCRTVKDALSWREWGKIQKAYKEPSIRT